MLVAATPLAFGRHTTHGLGAHDLATEQTQRGIRKFFSGSRAFPTYRLVCQSVVCLGQTHELEDGRMR